jgi:hypothetical protein
VNQFFRNTLKRNHTGFRPDVLVTSSGDGPRTNHFVNDSVSENLDVERVDQGNSPVYNNSYCDISDHFNNIEVSDSNNHGLIKQNGQNSMAENGDLNAVSRPLLDSDAMSSASFDSPSMGSGGGLCEASIASETCALPSERHDCAPNLCYHLENGKKVDLSDDTNLSNHGMPTKRVSGRPHDSFEDAKYSNGFSGSSPPLFGHHAYSAADLVDDLANYNSVYKLENSQPGDATNDIVPDLSGDFHTIFNNLLYAQECQRDNPIHQFYYQMMPPPAAQYWNTRPSLGPGTKSPYEYAGTNEAVPGPPHSPGYFVLRQFHQTDDHMVMKARGTGTYFPNPVCSLSLLAHSSYACTTFNNIF